MKLSHVAIGLGAGALVYVVFTRLYPAPAAPQPTATGGLGKVVDGVKDIVDAVKSRGIVPPPTSSPGTEPARDIADPGATLPDEGPYAPIPSWGVEPLPPPTQSPPTRTQVVLSGSPTYEGTPYAPRVGFASY